MRVLGIDPGLTRCGAAVVEGGPGQRLTTRYYGVLTTPVDADISIRLAGLEAAITELVDTHEPQVVAVERVFSQQNVRTAMGTAQAAAMALLVAGRRGLPIALHTPTEVKAAVTGSGRADKAQVTSMVTRLLNLDAPPRPADTADALAIAICQVWRGGADRRLAAAVAASRR